VFLVDTNVLLHAVNQDSRLHEQARAALEGWLGGAERFALTWSVVYEFLRVSTHAAVFPRPLTFDEALAFVEPLLASRAVTVLVHTEEHAAQLRAAAAELPDVAGSRFHDLHVALLMRAHGVRRVRTLDSDFHRFPWVRPESPFPPG
jgi:uncharacterized protein